MIQTRYVKHNEISNLACNELTSTRKIRFWKSNNGRRYVKEDEGLWL